MSKKQDDLISFLAGIPGATFVNVSNDGVSMMEGPKYEKLRQLHERGVSLHAAERYADAIRCFKDAIDQGFQDSKPYLNIGVCYAEMHQWSEALEWLRLAVSKFPQDEQIRRNLAVAEERAKAEERNSATAAVVVKFACQCGKRLHAKGKYVGKRAKCPACGAVVSIPSTAGGESSDKAQQPSPSLAELSGRTEVAEKGAVQWYTRESSAKRCKQIIVAEKTVSLCESPIGGPFMHAPLQRVRAWGMATVFSGNAPYLCVKCVGVEEAIKTVPCRLAFAFYRYPEAGLFQPLLEIVHDVNKPFVVAELSQISSRSSGES